MTTEEKRDRIREYCYNKNCDQCPLYNVIQGSEKCFEDDADIDRNYAILFGNKDETTEETPDNVNHPSHYETGKFECIDVMIETQGVEAVKSFCLCNAFKYLYRHKNKNGVEDVKKAIWYLNKFIELE
jgi:hypothetical protein